MLRKQCIYYPLIPKNVFLCLLLHNMYHIRSVLLEDIVEHIAFAVPYLPLSNYIDFVHTLYGSYGYLLQNVLCQITFRSCPFVL